MHVLLYSLCFEFCHQCRENLIVGIIIHEKDIYVKRKSDTEKDKKTFLLAEKKVCSLPIFRNFNYFYWTDTFFTCNRSRTGVFRIDWTKG